jgi:hypothetical protein
MILCYCKEVVMELRKKTVIEDGKKTDSASLEWCGHSLQSLEVCLERAAFGSKDTNAVDACSTPGVERPLGDAQQQTNVSQGCI